MDQQIRVCSLFSGIGGIDLGFQQAGYKIIWANEIDKSACKTYIYNFGSDYLVEKDIKQVNPRDIPDFDILVAGFPCQPFSLAGKQRGFNDDRGELFFEIEKIIREKKPKVVFLENVANLINHNKGKSFETVFLSLAQEGYVVRYQTLNPKTHADIPQQRERVFVVAFDNFKMANAFKYPDEIVLRQKITNIINLSEKHSDIYYYNKEHKQYVEMINTIKVKGLIHRINDEGVSKQGYTICPTLTANMGTFPDRVPLIRDDFGIRKLTPYECLKFQGYPNNFRFPPKQDINKAYKQIGNSVCVPIIKRLAEEIKKVYNIDD